MRRSREQNCQAHEQILRAAFSFARDGDDGAHDRGMD
jgi:hypothetical protein